MIIRDVDGNLHIINRNDCKNDSVYYQKIYKIREVYMTKYKLAITKKEQSK